MRAVPEAVSSRRLNCRSVAFSALSGMLLTSPIVTSAPSARANASCAGASAGLAIGGCLSNSSVMAGLANLFGGLDPPRACAGRSQRLVDIFDDVGDVLDADRKPDGFRQHAGHALLLGRHLAVRGRCRVAGERFGVADIDEAGDQLQRVVEGFS